MARNNFLNAFRNLLPKRFSKKRIIRRFKKPFYPSYDTRQLLNCLKSCGLQSGRTVFIHSSWGEFYNYSGTPIMFIEAILDELGPDGTLAMPAFPKNKESFFDIKKTPSNAGYLTEVFRKYPGVKRSLNSQHSVCAIGLNSEYLTNEHHLSETCWDKHSPYYKLAKTDTVIFALGLKVKNFVPTIWHCPESLLKSDLKYYKQFWGKKINCKYLNCRGQIFFHQYYTRPDDLKLERSRRDKYINTHFDSRYYHHSKLSNLIVRSYQARYTLNRLLELAQKGIVPYDKPEPSKYFH